MPHQEHSENVGNVFCFFYIGTNSLQAQMCRRGVPEHSLIPHLLSYWGTNTMRQLCTPNTWYSTFSDSPKTFQSFISQLSRRFVLDNHGCNSGDTFQPWGLNKKSNCFHHFLFWFHRSALPYSGQYHLPLFGLSSPTSPAHPPGMKQAGNVWSGSSSKGNIVVATFCKEINLNGAVCVCTGHSQDWEFHWVQ